MNAMQKLLHCHALPWLTRCLTATVLFTGVLSEAEDWQLVWSDEFDGPNIDTSKWSHEVNGWDGVNGLQYYTARTNNSFIENGNLVIQALEEDYSGWEYNPWGRGDWVNRNYTSARLRTRRKGDWTYGRFEARMKLPYGQGMWPAFWMMPTDSVYGGWAASGEIDIMENIGREPRRVHGSLHFGGSWPKNVSYGRPYRLPSGNVYSSFHTYALEWEPGEFRWYVDGVHYLTQRSWYTTSAPFPAPFDKRFHIILNVTVGGNWPGSPDGTTVFPQRMEVDYVRVYSATNAPPPPINIRYVDINNPSPSYPYTSWETAANDIQTAVYAASDGDTVLIADGIYDITEQIYVDKSLAIQSVNGPESVTVDAGGNCRVFWLKSYNGAITLDGLTVTGGFAGRGGGIRSQGPNSIEIIDCIIEGNAASRGGGGMFLGRAINCIIENNNSERDGGGILRGRAINCTIEGNTARNGGGMSDGTAENCVFSNNSANGGGGLADSTAYNCIIEGNEAAVIGGGMSGGTAWNCLIRGNSALIVGGGMSGGTVVNCNVIRNMARVGGGIFNGTAYNSIVWHNAGATANQDMNTCVAIHSCSPDVEHGVSGNITNMPLLVSASHIASDSPCIAAGEPAFAAGTDIDGQPWLNPPSMGCDEFHGAGSVTGYLYVAIGGTHILTEDFPSDLFADISGPVSSHVWDFGDAITETNKLTPKHIWQTPGIYDVTLTAYSDSYPDGISVTQTVHVGSLDEVTLYVDADTGNDANDGSNWDNAKRTINNAVQSHQYYGGRILVTDGVYGLSEQITVDKALLIESVNGAADTIIDGDGDHLCVYLGPGCRFRGFSVRNGIGGIWGFYSSIIEDCRVYENAGTGIWGGSVYDSVIRNNMNYGEIGGGLDDANAYNCLVVSNLARIGGGIDMSGGNNGEYEGKYEAVNCVVIDNSAEYGGGILGGEARNCLVSGNEAFMGGGIHKTIAVNCTIAGNSALDISGASESSLYNSIVCSNMSINSYPEVSVDSIAHYSCSTGLMHGVNGNINTDPLFIDPANGDYRLLATSPCIDAGTNGFVWSALDLEGKPRIVDGDFDGSALVDMGAYEFQVIHVAIDIKPGSGTNPINLKSRGRVPVAVMGSDELDVTTIHIDSIRFAGAAPVHHTMADVGGDGHPDLILHFKTQELNLQDDSTFAMLVGETHEGMLLGGLGSISIVPPKK